MDELKERAFGVAALETLALIAEHRLTLQAGPTGSTLWYAWQPGNGNAELSDTVGATIGDAVRACVRRIKEGNRG